MVVTRLEIYFLFPFFFLFFLDLMRNFFQSNINRNRSVLCLIGINIVFFFAHFYFRYQLQQIKKNVDFDNK